MNLAGLKKEVLTEIKPSKAEVEKELRVADELMERIWRLAPEAEEIVLCGSLARDTHLKGDRDIDLFVLFPEDMPREKFVKEGLRVGRAVFKGHQWEEAYSQHPYIRGEINGYKAEVVPSYKVGDASLLKSAVDRSPFHTKYLQARLKEKQKDEVRLLRQWLKGIKCYGAELRFSSVPGYVTELLVLAYGDFEKTVKAMARWRKGQVIDLEGHYPDEGAAQKVFDNHFVVVDPVDKNRNVAAALSFNQFSRMIAAARAFEKKPSKNFFFGKREGKWPVAKLKRMLGKTELVAAAFSFPKGALADVFWGQLRRFRKKMANELKEKDFDVVRSEEWTDEKSVCVLVFELEAAILQKVLVRVGPEVADEANSARFLKAHQKLLSGPRIEEGRWVVEVERKHVNAKKVLKALLERTRKSEKENLRKALKKATVLGEPQLVKLFQKNAEFAEFLSRYLKGEEDFLDY